MKTRKFAVTLLVAGTIVLMAATGCSLINPQESPVAAIQFTIVLPGGVASESRQASSRALDPETATITVSVTGSDMEERTATFERDVDTNEFNISLEGIPIGSRTFTVTANNLVNDAETPITAGSLVADIVAGTNTLTIPLLPVNVEAEVSISASQTIMPSPAPVDAAGKPLFYKIAAPGAGALRVRLYAYNTSPEYLFADLPFAQVYDENGTPIADSRTVTQYMDYPYNYYTDERLTYFYIPQDMEAVYIGIFNPVSTFSMLVDRQIDVQSPYKSPGGSPQPSYDTIPEDEPIVLTFNAPIAEDGFEIVTTTYSAGWDIAFEDGGTFTTYKSVTFSEDGKTITITPTSSTGYWSTNYANMILALELTDIHGNIYNLDYMDNMYWTSPAL